MTIIRIVDAPGKRFELGDLYRDRFGVLSVYTRPEAEILAIVNEGCYSGYVKHKSRMKPSEYCKQILGMRNVKAVSYLKQYWSAERLAAAVREYKRVSKLSKDEHCIADLLVGG